MRTLLGCALVLSTCCVALADDEKIDTKKLIGKWTTKEKDKEGLSSVLEFAKDGKLTLIVNSNGKEETFDGTYKVDGTVLTLTLKFPIREVTHTNTVVRLTDAELDLKSDQGSETLVRVKKKDKK
jgi:uncharacterized protein (TIGR03066 family)